MNSEIAFIMSIGNRASRRRDFDTDDPQTVIEAKLLLAGDDAGKIRD